MPQFAGRSGMERPPRPRARVAAAPLLLLGGLSCGAAGEPVAAIALELERAAAPQGAFVAATLSLTVLPAFEPLDRDYRVFLHFLDGGGQLLWADDHDPPTPSSAWRPGQTLSWRRHLLIPVAADVGPATVAVGLYYPPLGERLPLAGEHLGQWSYRAAGLTVEPAAGDVLTREHGWYDEEFESGAAPGAGWRWTGPTAGLSFPDPQADAALQLLLDGRPDLVPGGRQEVHVLANGEPLRRIVVDSRERQFVEVLLPAELLARGPAARIELHVRQTFVPAAAAAASGDQRRLGVRVHRAALSVR